MSKAPLDTGWKDQPVSQGPPRWRKLAAPWVPVGLSNQYLRVFSPFFTDSVLFELFITIYVCIIATHTWAIRHYMSISRVHVKIMYENN
jgi:hypothetical protein